MDVNAEILAELGDAVLSHRWLVLLDNGGKGLFDFNEILRRVRLNYCTARYIDIGVSLINASSIWNFFLEYSFVLGDPMNNAFLFHILVCKGEKLTKRDMY